MVAATDPGADPTRLHAWLPAAKVEPDEALERFLAWIEATGIELYPAQEAAVLEIMSGRHVVLATPTGSGKSLVATAMHFLALCTGRRCAYTSPIKALVNEKFFDLCRELGPHNVGMTTGDATVNKDAPILCCTAEILANLALREGEHARVDGVVMDEFHFYSDPDRGIAWQLPLLTLPQARFLLMSATLGDVSAFQEGIARYAGGEVVLVESDERPVPLDWEYRETPVHETIQDLVDKERAPVYVVSFTQRECAEQAQALTSLNLCSKDNRKKISETIGDFRFDTTYGKDVRRMLSHGIGLHHAGLLPKYRALVERLAQRGLLAVICGTDTLGVGVNVPIRTVLFTKLCKYDGEKVRILTVRDFKQIAGRAGRKGFDTRGSVVVQAPEHVIENKRLEAKARAVGKKKFNRKKPPERGFVNWDAETFAKLRDGRPEALESRFEVSHGMLLSVIDREFHIEKPHGGYRRVIEIVGRSYERPAARSRHRRHAAVLFRSLREAGVLEVARPGNWPRPCVRVSPGLQRDFSLHHTLSLYLLDALAQLDPESDTYALDVLGLVEAILETPRAVVQRQLAVLKDELFARLREAGAEYEERMAKLEALEPPKPNAEFVYRTFDVFRVAHPWVRSDNVRPKSIARDMVERFASFNEYVKEYGLGRSEGVLLRYLSQAYKTLVQNVPVAYHDERVVEVVAFLRAMLARVDSSLVSEWEKMMSAAANEAPLDEAPAVVVTWDLARDEKALRLRVRTELHALVKALARGDLEEALGGLRHDPDDAWSIERLEAELAPCLAEIGKLDFSPAARYPKLTTLKAEDERSFIARQVLVGPEGETPWFLEAEIDLRDPDAADGPLLSLRRIAT